MFSVYGLSGQAFSGTLEELARVREPLGVARVRAIGEHDNLRDAAPPPHSTATSSTQLQQLDAVQTYRTMVHVNADRGPLYHADQLMQRQVITVTDSDSVEHAWRTLVTNRIHQAPVLDINNQLIGIVSERDLLTALNVEAGQLRDVLARTVQDVMTSPVVCAQSITDIRLIAKVMLDYGVAGVPIVNETAGLVGFISRSDILSAVIADPPLSLWR